MLISKTSNLIKQSTFRDVTTGFFNQWKVLPRSGLWRVISMEFLRSFLRRHSRGNQWWRRVISTFFSGSTVDWLYSGIRIRKVANLLVQISCTVILGRFNSNDIGNFIWGRFLDTLIQWMHSRGLRPGSKKCSEHMNNWQYLSSGDLEQNELFPKSESWGFLFALKGLCHPTRMREPMKTNLKKSARLFQVLSEILEGCFYLSKSQSSFDS